MLWNTDYICFNFQEAESEKLEKINAVTAKSDVAHVQEDQVKQQQDLLETTIKKVDLVAEKREQKLQERKDKLKAREEHAARVRLRKKLHIPTQEELDVYEAMNTDSSQQVTASDVVQVPVEQRVDESWSVHIVAWADSYKSWCYFLYI